MIDYETYCKIRDHRDRQRLSITQTAQALGLHPETVSKWSRRERYEQRAPLKRGSQLDPYKGLIVRWLEAHPLSAQQIFQRLREAGYPGGLTIVNMYVRRIRPPKHKAFLKLRVLPARVRYAVGRRADRSTRAARDRRRVARGWPGSSRASSRRGSRRRWWRGAVGRQDTRTGRCGSVRRCGSDS